MSLVIPTDVSDQQIREFQFLYWKHFKKKMTVEEARAEAITFLQFMTTIIDNSPNFMCDKSCLS